MSSFKNNRVVIASLFLPNTAILTESTPATPTAATPALRPPLSLKKAVLNLPPAARSIVEDLTDKTRNVTPASLTPANEIANPFAKLTRMTTSTLDAVSSAIQGVQNDEAEHDPLTSPPAGSRNARKHQTTHTDHTANNTSRLQRKSSSVRSPSRRSGSIGACATSHQNWHIEPNSHCNGGLKNAIHSLENEGKLRKKLWVGTLGNNTDKFDEPLRRDINTRMGKNYSSVPVWIPDAEFESCYDEFCHQVLWPSLHYAIPDAPKTKMFYESGSFKQYAAVNQRFADAIIANYQDGDIIWVNDYHLMLLPALLRASPLFPADAPIGFFMHVAFPSSEIFRCLSVREDLLKGILAADLVGFQTASFARHFRQTVSRILAWEALPKGIQVPPEEGTKGAGDGKEEGRERFVDVGVYPMGIDVKALAKKRQEPEVSEWVNVLKQRYAGMKIVVGRDKLDEIQGVRHKIKAFERFLDKYPQFQEKVVLIQVALQTTESNELAGGVADVVSHINSRFSTLTYQPVVFLHTQDLTFSQYLALLSVADAFLVTSLREGMALRAHEFVECQEGTHRPLILSEFTGSYSYSGFRSCIAINPWDTRGTADAINQALTMPEDEALSRWEDLHNHVITQTAQAFVTSFLTRLVRAHTEHMHAHADPDTGSTRRLSIPRLLPRYKHSSSRLIVVDFEGTLWIRDISRAGLLVNAFTPPEEAIEVLRVLSRDKRNEVWLMSGLPVKGMMGRVAEMLPDVGIVAENGCFIKTKGKDGPWINMCANFNLTWRGSCLEILNYFTERTPGSFVEERQASVVWRFWTGDSGNDCADRAWARRQAAEAQNHIFDSLGERYGLRIIPGQNSFLVLPNNISRSTAIAAILHPGGPTRAPPSGRRTWDYATDSFGIADNSGNSGGGGVDGGDGEDRFVFAASSDEKLLARLNEFDLAETCSTSGKGTDAKWRMEPTEAIKVLKEFAAGALARNGSVGP